VKLILPEQLEQEIQEMLRSGEYSSPEALLEDAFKALRREREREKIESLLSELDSTRILDLLQEAENSGDYTEMTAQDWEDIEREGLALLHARKPD
jgi:Arc/MetJ-type ribon-helix-helix transcriptional regulator